METLARPSTSWDCKPSLEYCLRLQFLPIAELSSAKGFVNELANVNKLDSPCQRPPGHFAVTEDGVTRGHHGTGYFPVGGTGRGGVFGAGIGNSGVGAFWLAWGGLWRGWLAGLRSKSAFHRSSQPTGRGGVSACFLCGKKFRFYQFGSPTRESAVCCGAIYWFRASA